MKLFGEWQLQETDHVIQPPSPLLLAALCFWVGCAGAFWQARHGVSVWIAIGLSCGLLASILLRIRVRRIEVYLLAFCVAGAFWGVCGAQETINLQREYLESGETATAKMIAVEDFKVSSLGYSGLARYCGDTGFSGTVKVYSSKDQQLFYGQSFQCRVRKGKISESAYDSFWSKGVVGSATLLGEPLDMGWESPFSLQRATFVQNFLQDFSANSDVALFLALACGYRSILLEDVSYEYFQSAGLAHIVAISGAHLSLVVSLVGAVLSALRVERRVRIVLQCCCALAFLFVSSIPVSAFRAAVMVIVSLLAFFARRRSSSQNGLALCILFFIACDPSTALSISFALSSLSTLGIVVFSGGIADLLGRAPFMKSRFLKESLGMTLGAQSTTMLLGAAIFAQVPLFGLLSNVLMSLMFAPLCVGCVLSGVFSFLGWGPFLGFNQIVLSGCHAVNILAHAIACIPGGCLAVSISVTFALLLTVFFCFALFMVLKGKKVQRYAICFLFCCCIWFGGIQLVSWFAPPELDALDVGQGDSLLIKEKNHFVLIDTGNDVTALRRSLARRGVRSLDAVFISHPDDDHCGCLKDVARICSVKNVYVAADLLECSCGNCVKLRRTAEEANLSLLGVRVGDTMSFAHITITVLSPFAFRDEGGNEDSLCIEVDVASNNTNKDYKALLVGDAEADALEMLITRGYASDVDIFKVGHHGSKASCSEKVLKTYRPEIALISVGENNRYGHPTEEVLNALKERGIAVFRTDQQGIVVCSFKDDGIHVSTLG